MLIIKHMYYQHIEFQKNLTETLKEIEKEGCEVIIAGAGLAAHLPGVIASNTITCNRSSSKSCT